MSAWMVVAIVVLLVALVGGGLALRSAKARDAKSGRRPEDDIYPLF